MTILFKVVDSEVLLLFDCNSIAPPIFFKYKPAYFTQVLLEPTLWNLSRFHVTLLGRNYQGFGMNSHIERLCQDCVSKWKPPWKEAFSRTKLWQRYSAWWCLKFRDCENLEKMNLAKNVKIHIPENSVPLNRLDKYRKIKRKIPRNSDSHRPHQPPDPSKFWKRVSWPHTPWKF